MKTILTPREESIVEFMRKTLAKNFGITVIEDHVTLRFTDKDGSHCTVAMRIDEIWTDDEVPCFSCGDTYDKEKLYETTVTTRLCSGSDYKRKVLMCYDCYCPK